MAKGINESVDSTSAKYNIVAKITINGVVEVQDVVGALFGQTEGLLNDLELRELQKTGRIGRIIVNSSSEGGITSGDIIIPSSLDRTETAILAATLETVDRVGPCKASLSLIEIRDLRESKLKQIEARAKELLKDWKSGSTDRENISAKINTELERESIITWHGLPAGSEIEKSDRIIIVEGRNDIQQLLKIGVKNTIAVNGTSVPKAIIDLTGKKECIAFLDGDRGGDMILNELLQVSKIKYYARAPLNREVEELSPKELVKCLQQKRPIEQLYKDRREKEVKMRTERNSNRNLPERPRTSFPSNQRNLSRDNRSSNREIQRREPRTQKNIRRDQGYDRRSSSNGDRRSSSNGDRRFSRGNDRSGRSFSSRNTRTQRGPRVNPQLESLPKAKIKDLVKGLISSNEAVAVDAEFNQIHRTSNVSIFKELDPKFNSVLIDGVITQNFLDRAIKQKIKKIIAVNIKRQLTIPDNSDIQMFYFRDFL
ncbi:MAG: DNA primase DnaG [Promethearchaeota archaeon]